MDCLSFEASALVLQRRLTLGQGKNGIAHMFYMVKGNHLVFESKATKWVTKESGELRGSVTLAVQLCPTLCDPVDCSPPGSSVHGILWTRTLEWVAVPFSRGSSRCKDWTRVSHIAGRFFTTWATREFSGEWERFKGDVASPKPQNKAFWCRGIVGEFLGWWCLIHALSLFTFLSVMCFNLRVCSQTLVKSR